MTAQQKKVLRAAMACRTEPLGTIRYRCVGCGHDETVPRSCCNRHCPACQHERVGAWLATQTELIRRWLLHVFPSGLHRVRHYGFLNSSSKRSLEEVRLLIAIATDRLHYLLCHEQLVMADSTKMVCPDCGNAMICLGYTPPQVIGCSLLPSTARAPP